MAIEITNEEIEEILKNLDESIEEEDKSLLGYLALAIGFDIALFANRVSKQITLLREAGLADAGIARLLANDLATNGRIFGELRNSIVRGIVLGVNQFSRFGQVAVYGDSITLFRWVTVQGHKICEDCIARSGEVDTWDNWEARGLPGTGWSVCQGNCYCILVPEETESSDTLKIDQNQLA